MPRKKVHFQVRMVNMNPNKLHKLVNEGAFRKVEINHGGSLDEHFADDIRCFKKTCQEIEEEIEKEEAGKK
ncbi:MAG TPA: hypothetical protein ENI70_01000 [Candidatus Peregrinibacteria bacterium]|nr:hypothetical protein [Candidatus Peregrinibacteria bacterium]